MNDLKQTTCKRCGRKLKTPKSIELGIGKTCYRKWQKECKVKPLFKFVNNEDGTDSYINN